MTTTEQELSPERAASNALAALREFTTRARALLEDLDQEKKLKEERFLRFMDTLVRLRCKEIEELAQAGERAISALSRVV